MLNQVILVGRIFNKTILNDKTIIELRIPQNFKNKDGVYDDDILQIEVKDTLAQNLNDYVGIGDLIGVKGSIRTNNIIVAEKITFLSSKNS